MKTEDQNNRIAVAALMPHAPVLIPAVGRGRERDAAATVQSMRNVSRRLLAAKPARIILISPHSPRRAGWFGWWGGQRLQGNLEKFGCPEVNLDLPNDAEFLQCLRGQSASLGIGFWEITDASLDHGALVPLAFLVESGWAGPTAVLGLNYPGEAGLEALGLGLARAAATIQGPIAVVASGDMSHRLRQGAPAGFHPRASEFDQTFVDLLRRGDYGGLAHLDPALQSLAAEDVVDATRVVTAAVGKEAAQPEVFSYEGPFGVGYCVAVLYESLEGRGCDGESLPDIAKQAVASRLAGTRPEPIAASGEYLARRRGVFVTIRNQQGELRGCRGTLEPQHANLVEETQSIALCSAFNDRRFESVRPEELPELHFEVSVLREPEEVDSTDQLDPEVFGVVVTAADGRRGVMLPQVDGLDTVEKQLEATRRKAGIGLQEPIKILRFQVDKYPRDLRFEI